MVLRNPAKGRYSTRKPGTARPRARRRKTRAKTASLPSGRGGAGTVFWFIRLRSNSLIFFGLGWSVAFSLALLQFLFFLVALRLFLQAFFGQTGLGFFLPLHLLELLFLHGRGFRRSVQRIRQVLHRIAEAVRILGGVGAGRLLDLPQLIELSRAALEQRAQAVAHIPIVLELVFNPAFEFVIQGNVLKSWIEYQFQHN